MPKSPDAFRTISEVADWLGVQAHVLRFWESKFTQVKPIKRAGGRRYYRPADMLLIGGIKKLLHDDGLTIKGVQKTLREQGVAFVADQSQPLDDLTMAVLDGSVASESDFDTSAMAGEASELAAAPAPDPAVETDADQEDAGQTELAPLDQEPVAETAEQTAPDTDPSENEVAEAAEDKPDQPADASALPSFLRHPLQDVADAAPSTDEAPADSIEQDAPMSADEEATTPEPTQNAPRVIDLPPLPNEADMPAAPAALAAVARMRKISPDQAAALGPLLAELAQLRDQMAEPAKAHHKD